jgi:lipopolysaccharide transport system permease protein
MKAGTSALPRRSTPWPGGSAALLRSHGRLLWRVTRNDLRARHAGSHLGVGWVFIAPLLVLGVYSVIYLYIFRTHPVGLTSAEYVVYIFCGLVPYLATADALIAGVASVISSKSILNNTVFPIDLAPIKPVLSSQVIMTLGMVLVVAAAFATGNFHGTIVLLPLIWLLNVLWLMGVNWLISLLNVIFRDLQSLLQAVLMIMLVASPFAYTPDMIPSELRPLIGLNPFAHFVVAYQQVIMLGIVPSLWHTFVLVTMSLGTFALGSWFFARAKRVVIDYV